MPLTAAKIRSAEARPRPYKIADGQGLFLHVAATGTKTLRFAYRFGGREKLLVFGRPGEISLADARHRRDDARQQLRQGRDPGARAAPAAANDIAGPTVAELVALWLAHKAEGWSAIHAADVSASLERDVLPAIGGLAAASITAPVVLELLEGVQARGSIETARRLRQRISMIYRLGCARGLVDVDPAARVTEALRRPAKPIHHPAALTIADARAALAAIAGAGGGASLQAAARFLALTAVRWAAVRGARWAEIEQLDGSEPLWRVPAVRMKGTVDRKADPSADHLVPLSPAAVALLRRARDMSIASPIGDTSRRHVDPVDLIFPGAGGGGMMGEGAMEELHHRAGLQGRHTPHGWRASFSTILVDARPADRAAVDLALGHVPKDEAGEQLDKVELAYNRAQHLGPRRILLDLWAEWLVGPGTAPVALSPTGA